MKDQILTIIQKYPGTSFVELGRIEGFRGDFQMRLGDTNLILWADISVEAAECIKTLLADQLIEMRTTSSWTYLIDGCSLSLPVAKSLKYQYVRLHWLPVVFHLRPPAKPKRPKLRGAKPKGKAARPRRRTAHTH